MSGRAWCLLSFGDSRQYGGNSGYEDDPTGVYRYDSSVANSKQLGAGDLVIIRDSERMLGAGVVEKILEKSGQKRRLRCPVCATTGLKLRKTHQPPWRCNNRHEFSEPTTEEAAVTVYEARYGETFVPAPDALPVSVIKRMALRPSDQLSIEELDSRLVETEILRVSPGAAGLMARFSVGTVLDAEESNEDVLPGAEDQSDGEGARGEFSPSVTDQRTLVLRSIKERRGQAAFRRSLIRRYGAQCLVSGCQLLDILEAAHIWPYRGADDNHVGNGLLLRADLHTLFDLNLMAIDPVSRAVRFAPVARDAGYGSLDGHSLRLAGRRGPSTAALGQRWGCFVSRYPVL